VAASVILYHSHCADGHTCDLKQQQWRHITRF
jgi:hypothetical protein